MTVRSHTILLVCDVCGFYGGPEEFEPHNEEFTCPNCEVDESGLLTVDIGERVDHDDAMINDRLRKGGT